MAKTHAVELHELSGAELVGFMKDIQTAARASKEVAGAVKIRGVQPFHSDPLPSG